MSVWQVNFAGFILLALIVWWFWGSRPAARRVEGKTPIEVLVDNGVYTPSVIETSAGKPVTLRFLRKDPSPCAEKVLFDTLGVSTDLPIDTPVELTIQPLTPGEYEFTCQMRMYRGTLVAR